MTNRNLEIIAMRESARATLAEVCSKGSVSKISIIATARALGFTQLSPRDNQTVVSASDIENRITIQLAGRAIDLLDGGTPDATSDCSSFAYAIHMAEQLADSEAPAGSACDWRVSEPQRAQNIVKRCLDRATVLVRDNQERIRSLASILVEKGELTQADIAKL